MSDGDVPVKPGTGRRGPRGIQTNHAELKRRRIAADLTLGELAEAAGSSKTNLSMIERGQYNAGRELLGRLAKALACDPAALMDGDGGDAA